MQCHWCMRFINCIYIIVSIDSGVSLDCRGWDSFDFHGAGTFVYPFDYRSKNRHRNLLDRRCVPPWWPLDCFGYLLELYIDICLIFESLTGGVCHLYYLYWLMAKGIVYGGQPFPDTGCPLSDVTNIYLMKCLMYGLLFLRLSTSLGSFHPRNFLFENGLDWFPCTPFILYLHTILSIISRCVVFRFSNWFSLRCLQPWMNHLPPVWWSNFRFIFLNESWCVSLT